MAYYATPQRRFDGSPLRQYTQQAAIEHPDSKHWENVNNNTLRAVCKLVDKREREQAAEMLSPDWFERHTWKQLSEAWQRVLAAAGSRPLYAVEIVKLLEAEAPSQEIPF